MADWTPYLHLQTARGEVRLLLGTDDDPQTVENVDGFIDLDDGTTRSFTILTLNEVTRLMARWQITGEEGAGSYLRIPDLIILRTGGVDSIAAAVVALADELPEIEIWTGEDEGP